MPTPAPTLDELIALLKRTNLPSVVTEGKDDYSFYRTIEEDLSDLKVSLIPVGGRTNLLEIFDRRKELGRNNIIFIADRDLWAYVGIPPEYAHRKIIFTDGYSIENDLFRDGEISRFLRGSEIAKYRQELTELLKWYSHCVRKLLNAEEASISEHPNLIIGADCCLNADHMRAIGFATADAELFSAISADHEKLLRGKTLVELIVRHLSHKDRDIKFGKKQVMEIGATRKGAYLQRIVGSVSDLMGAL